MRPHRLPSTFIRSAAAGGALAFVCVFGVQAQTGVPALRGEGGVRYVCGGIGSDESGAMRAAMKDHPLSLLFSRADGAYVADVDVAIHGSAGAPSLRLRAGGPICLIDLPAGAYAVEVSAGGPGKRQDVTVGGTPKTLDFRF